MSSIRESGRPPHKVSPQEQLPREALDTLVEVLDELRFRRAQSRAEVANRTRLSRGIVAQRIGELIARGLVEPGDTAPSTGGRPPRQLEFRATAGHVLVASVGATSVDVAVTDLNGRVLGHYGEPANVASGPETILDRVDELLGDVRATTRSVPGRLWGVGIGLPGPVEFATGRPVSPPIMPGWDDYPVRDRFAARYDAPVWVDNDVNILALGEWRSGVAQGHQDVVVVKIGSGIGAGIISNELIHRGAQGSAGDIGHIQVVEDASVVCRCGNVGCLEALAGGSAIGRQGEAAAREGRSARLRDVMQRQGGVTAEDVARAADFGDPVAVDLLQTAGRRVGLILASVVNLLNPSLIVIGGGVAQSGDWLLAAIREVVYRRSLPLATRKLQIERASLGGRGPIIGASAMVVDQLFAREYFVRWIALGEPAGMPSLTAAPPA